MQTGGRRRLVAADVGRLGSCLLMSQLEAVWNRDNSYCGREQRFKGRILEMLLFYEQTESPPIPHIPYVIRLRTLAVALVLLTPAFSYFHPAVR